MIETEQRIPQPGDTVRADGYERRVVSTYTQHGRDYVEVMTYGRKFPVTLYRWQKWVRDGEVLHV